MKRIIKKAPYLGKLTRKQVRDAIRIVKKLNESEQKIIRRI